MKEKRKARPDKGRRVIVAMSGGVDSSVSAALLKRDGFDVTGMFMKCWAPSAESYGGSSAPPAIFQNTCTSDDDERMARLAAEKIGIPFYSINLIKEYKERVVEYLLDGYKKGITPNPDVMCNKEIKFGLFFKKAMELGADYVATGHYARLKRGTHNKRSQVAGTSLVMGRDKNKDQSYFLAMIKPEVLEKVMFPIGEYEKSEVRKLAKEFGLPNAERKDSQGICFVGKVDFANFLKQYIPPKEGNIVDTEGNILGKHEGAFYYTIGQRKGLGLAGGPYFVVDKDMKKNLIVVSKDEKDLLKKEVIIKDLNWFVEPVEGQITAQVRYRQIPTAATVTLDSIGKMCTLEFRTTQRAVAPGQLAVLYSGEQILAAGIII
jgi:tRNA-uridine 2-sulfurtransferase